MSVNTFRRLFYHKYQNLRLIWARFVLVCLIEEENTASMAVFESLNYSRTPRTVYFSRVEQSGGSDSLPRQAEVYRPTVHLNGDRPNEWKPAADYRQGNPPTLVLTPAFFVFGQDLVLL